MCHNKSLFTDYRALSRPSTITLPNGKCISVTHSGTILVSPALALHGVLYIPSFKYNLLSVSKLSNKHNCRVIFTPKCCFMQAPSMRRPQVLGELFIGLYLFQTSSSASSQVLDSSVFQLSFPANHDPVCNASISDSELWNARLGHLSLTKLQNLRLLSSHVLLNQ